MSDFWENISRYPRFFVSSSIGLLLVILTPFKNLLRVFKFRIFFVIIFALFCVFLYFVFKNMTGF